MGAVFAATDERSGTDVAIKVIHPHVAKAGVNAERFRREVTLAQQVGHPGIVRVYDAGQDPAAGLFLVMELLQGVTLRAPLMQGDLTVLQALEVMNATLDALAAAHRIGIVHRDLKPDNIFLHAPDEEIPQVKLLDFGVARQANAAGITTTNVGLGTPHFMAPEQATDARSVTPASDVWSAGVILYYILSGALPFDGDGPYDTVLRACTIQHVPLDRRAPDADYRLVDIVETCLEKDPLERFQDASELFEVLAPLLRDPGLVEAASKKVAAEPRLERDGWGASADSWDHSGSGGGSQGPSLVPVLDVDERSSISFAGTAVARGPHSDGSTRPIERPAPLPLPTPEPEASGVLRTVLLGLVVVVIASAGLWWKARDRVAVEALSSQAVGRALAPPAIEELPVPAVNETAEALEPTAVPAPKAAGPSSDRPVRSRARPVRRRRTSTTTMSRPAVATTAERTKGRGSPKPAPAKPNAAASRVEVQHAAESPTTVASTEPMPAERPNSTPPDFSTSSDLLSSEPAPSGSMPAEGPSAAAQTEPETNNDQPKEPEPSDPPESPDRPAPTARPPKSSVRSKDAKTDRVEPDFVTF